MIYRQIVSPLTVAALGVIVAITAPEHVYGFPLQLVGWIVAGFAAMAFAVVCAMIIRQQNIDKVVSSNMLSSGRTRVLTNDRDHFESDRMVE